MKKNKYSKTAQIVAAVRAGHFKFENGIIFKDEYAPYYIDGIWKFFNLNNILFNLLTKKILKKLLPIQAQILIRASVCEQLLIEKINNGIEQYIILGAGFDSFAIKYKNQFPRLKIFELDHPNTQNFKKIKNVKHSLHTHSNTFYIPIDFNKQTIQEVLLNSSFDINKPCFISWLGTTYYLNKITIQDTLSSLYSLIAKDSFVFLDYGLDDAELSPETIHENNALKKFVAKAGEPFLSSFTNYSFNEMVKNIQFKIENDISPDEIKNTYLKGVNIPFSLFSQFVFLKK